MTELPISPDVFWPLVGLAGLLLALFAVFAILPKEARAEDAALEKLKVQMGLGGLHSALFLLAILFWTALFLLLFLSLAVSIVHSVGTALSDGAAEAVRRDVIVIAGLTATLGAVVALPFTLIRLTLTRKQTTHAEDVLFNEKITEAQRDLYAQRQVTIEHNGGYHDVWEDDIVRRNAAIDQLERLVKERRDVVENVASVLSVYVRELSKREPAEIPPEDSTPEELRGWARRLALKRSDMEKAVQTLGRLRHHDPDLIIDLRSANLQRMTLAQLDFEKAWLSGAQMQGAHLYRAQMQGANLSWAQMDDKTSLTAATLRGAAVRGVDYTKVSLTQEQIDSVFGDASVGLPADLTPPARFSHEYATWAEFDAAWRA